MKRCERCNQEFVGRSNRAKWCRACRPLVEVEREAEKKSRRARRVSWSARSKWVPVERRCGCGEVFVASAPHARYCLRCRALTRLAKYGPGSNHAQSRDRWVPIVATGTVRCRRGADCLYSVNGLGGFILPGQKWDLGHVDGNPSLPASPEHLRCNRATASRRR
jgi:hypothetical protein